MFVYEFWHFYSKGSSSKMKFYQMVACRLPGMSHRHCFFFWGGPGRYREKTIIGHHFFCTKDLRQLHRRYIFCEEMLNKYLWNFIKSQSLAKGLYKRRPGFMSPRVPVAATPRTTLISLKPAARPWRRVGNYFPFGEKDLFSVANC